MRMAVTTSRGAQPPSAPSAATRGLLAVVAVVPFVAAIAFLWWGFLFLRDFHANQIIIVVLAIVWGVGGMVLLFTTANVFVEQLPSTWTQRLTPVIFVGPAVAMLIWGLALPTIRTFLISLSDSTGLHFVGLSNYLAVFTDPAMLTVLRNNLLWLVFGTTFTVIAGLLVAVFADRSRFETAAKAMIFMPMAISFVGAGVIWNFVYALRPADAPQIGMLNAFFVGLFHAAPHGWTSEFQPLNNFFLIVIVIWLQTGYSMVLFSAAIKGIPEELLEAARVDGANEVRIFFSIMIPQIMGTIITVTTTVVIFTLKIFDVVWVMTGGNFGTSVIATEFYRQFFTYNNNGYGATLAVILMLAVIPVMAYNLRQFAQREVF
jgi:alpha-glucoside transport system permease protein